MICITSDGKKALYVNVLGDESSNISDYYELVFRVSSLSF